MSIYSFCNNCEHIKVTQVKGLNKPFVEEWDCPARGNPYEPVSFGEEINPHGCPFNAKFVERVRARKHYGKN
jgi:hypothetical protein